MSVLQQNVVLVLNKAWQAIHVKTPQEAFVMLAGDAATALDIDGESITPVSFDKWLLLRVREQDRSVMTMRGPVRVPSVIVLCNYSKVPKRRPKLCSKSVRERDGNKCMYTGRVLRPEEGSVDHVLPRSRGGRNDWHNVVWSAKEVNAKKGAKLPHEAGLRLLATPKAPLEVPVSVTIRNTHQIPDWKPFLTHAV